MKSLRVARSAGALVQMADDTRIRVEISASQPTDFTERTLNLLR